MNEVFAEYLWMGFFLSKAGTPPCEGCRLNDAVDQKKIDMLSRQIIDVGVGQVAVGYFL